MLRLLPGGSNDLLSIGRRVFWLSKLRHDFPRGLQESLQPENNLPFHIMRWNPRWFSLCRASVDFFMANVIAVSFSILHRVGGSETIALRIVQQAKQQAGAVSFETISAPSAIAS